MSGCCLGCVRFWIDPFSYLAFAWPCRIESDDFQHVVNALIAATTVGEMRAVIEDVSKDLTTYLADCELLGDANKKRGRDGDVASGDETSAGRAPRQTTRRRLPSSLRPSAPAPRQSINALGLFRRAHVSEPRLSPRVSDSPLADLWLRLLLNEKLAAGPVNVEARPVLAFLLGNLNGTDEFMDLADDGCTALCSVAMAKFFKAIGVAREEVECVFAKAGVEVPPKFRDL